MVRGMAVLIGIREITVRRDQGRPTWDSRPTHKRCCSEPPEQADREGEWHTSLARMVMSKPNDRKPEKRWPSRLLDLGCFLEVGGGPQERNQNTLLPEGPDASIRPAVKEPGRARVHAKRRRGSSTRILLEPSSEAL